MISAGEIFLDEKQIFYSPSHRKMRHLGLARINVWRNILRAWRKSYQGNMKGEGFILGGLYVIGPENQGILMEHQEKEFGDKTDLRSVLQAVKKMQKSN
ncbi:selenoprotein U1b isoform X1 [Tachysurus ichikawai]